MPPAPPDPVASERVEIDVTAVVAGGDGLGRHADGRVVLVRGALPGERVTAVVTKAEKRLLRAEVDEVVVAAPARVAPPCPRVADGCGGCGWQHVAPDAQPALKAAIAADALRRIGRLEPPAIDLGPRLDPTGYRTTVRAAVDDEGRAALRRHHTHDLVVVGDTEAGCLVAHPLVDEVLRVAAFPGAGEVVVRAGAATGERLVVVDPSGAARAVGVPDGVRVVGGDHLRGSSPTRAWYHEEVAGRRFRISARSFFQARPDGAAALVDAVRDAAAGASDGAALGGRSRLVDLYGGVGLFAAALGAEAGGGVTLVESAASAVADARVNLRAIEARVIAVDCRRWRPSPAELVVADPARAGLGAEVVERMAATGAPTVVVVSCDPAALGRDAGLLVTAGYALDSLRLVDLFPGTPHVEVVSGWRRR
jgi:23S rRNA (uracil1939-C5)-methyltransferase